MKKKKYTFILFKYLNEYIIYKLKKKIINATSIYKKNTKKIN